jgi:hypothetical protein
MVVKAFLNNMEGALPSIVLALLISTFGIAIPLASIINSLGDKKRL